MIDKIKAGDKVKEGDTLIVKSVPSTPTSITGPVTACANQQNVAYSTPINSTATSYSWTVPSGALVTAGQGTNSMVMKFGTAGGNVKVSALNGCGYYGSKSLVVAITCREEFSDLNNAFDVSVYPNPSKNVFMLSINSSVSLRSTFAAG